MSINLTTYPNSFDVSHLLHSPTFCVLDPPPRLSTSKVVVSQEGRSRGSTHTPASTSPGAGLHTQL